MTPVTGRSSRHMRCRKRNSKRNNEIISGSCRRLQFLCDVTAARSRRSPTRHGSFSPQQNLMKLFNLIILSLCLTGFLGLSAISAAEEEASWIEQTSPKGNYQIQKVENQNSR